MSAPSLKENVVDLAVQPVRPAPLTPADCDLRGLQFMPLDVVRLRESDLAAISTGDEFKAAVLLWCAAWNQLPAASLPCDDRIIARLAQCSHREWAAVKATALRGWVICSDGRLYHPTVAEKALEAWAERREHQAEKENEKNRKQRERDDRRDMFAHLRARGNVLPWNTPTAQLRQLVTEKDSDKDTPVTRTVTAEGVACHADSHAPDTAKTGTGTGTVKEEKSSEPSGSAPTRGAEDFDGRAWDAAVGLLTMDRRTSERAARSLFGKLLATNGLQARDLLPALIGAAVNGTQDAKAYLTKAAGHIATRRTSGRQQDVDWC